MNKLRTQYRYLVKTNQGELKNWDFIQHSNLFYYYQERTLLNDRVYEDVLKVFEQWREQVVSGDTTFSWDQFTKMPYLYQSLGVEQQLRFPLIFNQDSLHCGGGRYFVVYNYFKHIQLSSVIISPVQLNLPRLYSVCDLETRLLNNAWIQRNLSKKARFTYHLDNDIVVATDLTKSIRNWYPFCKNSERNQQLKQRIQDLLCGMDTRTQSIESVLHSICQLSV